MLCVKRYIISCVYAQFVLYELAVMEAVLAVTVTVTLAQEGVVQLEIHTLMILLQQFLEQLKRVSLL
jgi:hypothetical protein